jgi:hypothetical protein
MVQHTYTLVEPLELSQSYRDASSAKMWSVPVGLFVLGFLALGWASRPYCKSRVGELKI